MGNNRKKIANSHQLKVIGILIVCLLLFTGCSLTDKFKSNSKQEDSADEPTIQTVKVEKVTNLPIDEEVKVWALVKPSVEMDLTASPGGQVKQVLTKLGDTVNEGDVIAYLQSEDVELAKRQAEDAVIRAEAAIQSSKQDAANRKKELQILVKKQQVEYEQLHKNLNKLKNDYDSGMATDTQLSQAENELETSRINLDLAKQHLSAANDSANLTTLEADLSNAKALLEKAEEELSQLEVKAPISGNVSSLSLIEGAEVRSGEIIARIDKVDPIQIVTQLSEEATSMIQGKTELTYSLESEGLQGKAPIVYLASVMDTTTKTYELRLEVANAEAKIKSGMQVMVQLTEAPSQIPPSIPKQSVVQKNGLSYVFVLVGDAVELRSVVLGRSNDFYYEVQSGVEVGELLVVAGQDQLEDQQKVISELVQK